MGRAYLTVRAPAGDRTRIRVTTDIFQNASDAYYGGWTMRLKYAMLEYDLTPERTRAGRLSATASVGMLPTVAIGQVESYWPRWLGSTALETSGFFSSSDVGAAAKLILPSGRGELYATVTNGPGYAHAESDRFKDVAIRFSYAPFAASSGLLRTLKIAPWYYKGWTASAFVLGGAGQAGAVSDGLRRDRRGVFVGLHERPLTFGAEYAQRLEEVESGGNTTVSPRILGERTGTLISAFTLARPLELLTPDTASALSIVARYDSFTPDQGPSARDRFLLAGATWDVNANFSLALDYQERMPAAASATVASRTWFLHWTASF